MVFCWKDYTLEEFEGLVKERELDKKAIEEIIRTYDINVYFKPSKFGDDGTIYPYSGDGKIKFVILINTNNNLKEQKISLVHDFIHIYYLVSGKGKYANCSEEDTKIEELIEKEAQRIYKKRSDFVNWIYNKFRK